MKSESDAEKDEIVQNEEVKSIAEEIVETKQKSEIEVKRAEERRVERERLLAQEATERRKSVVEDVVGSSSQTEAGGSSSQIDIEMVDVENFQVQDVEAGQDFVLVGESSESFDPYEIIHRVSAIQKKRKAKETLLLEWKTQQFILVGKASTVPYSVKEIARQIKIKERRRKAKIARGEIVDDDSDIELFGDEEEEEDDNDDDKKDDYDDKDDKGDNDNDQESKSEWQSRVKVDAEGVILQVESGTGTGVAELSPAPVRDGSVPPAVS
ncbi:DNA ligase 1-like [Helianthus annuus]|uniref:DNA ligase 1-like n=1 Tax=Helianthus annuus TaxID=4232 RepID=UPI000B9041C1|nr:DNA ligase 1-like [Helianthus annuus]